ncbi:sigma-70 family RNA polymerase sigma factor [Thermaerobacter sp. PB12/4term]|uniref:RNA polymerase sigma factor n=1 Tax=Thermaerobacter sp. PB12/4term TaxID=2293838 RepID=UPI0013147638|nr:sigma-70 family RNA polymerase sigma factor [Thermaerobacter sp. PB12/4term]QIA27551.1 sigma-70 family RNA polymerase sigma factor [Thermaerobacter sp. PB12/4term]
MALTPAATVPADRTGDLPPDLVDRIRRGDPGAVAEMVRRLGGAVLYLARLILGPAGTDADAEEVAADALVAAWQRAAEFDPARGRFRTWVFMLLKYAALDRRRQLERELRRRSGWLRRVGAGPGRGPDPAPQPGGPAWSGLGYGLPSGGHAPVAPADPAELVAARDEAVRLRMALESLPPAERDLLIRRYWLEEPIERMAREAGISRNAMDSRLWRARQALRRAMEPPEPADRKGDRT